jgi:hypothetical protein
LHAFVKPFGVGSCVAAQKSSRQRLGSDLVSLPHAATAKTNRGAPSGVFSRL